MSFQPVVPLSGYAGWAFLQKTRDAQQATFNKSPVIARDTDYFAAKIGSVTSAKDLVNDRRLLKVALGAFGLDDDINNKFFVQKVLSDGTSDAGALANKLADKRYLAFATAFGLDQTPPASQAKGFADKITRTYEDRQFEIAVGDTDGDLRMAMGISRDLGAIASSTTNSANGKWYSVMGLPAVRTVMETAMGLPSSVGKLDLDQQLTAFRNAAQKTFGNSEVAQFSDPAVQDKLIRNFLVRSQMQSSGMISGQQMALTMLQSMPNLHRR